MIIVLNGPISLYLGWAEMMKEKSVDIFNAITVVSVPHFQFLDSCLSIVLVLFPLTLVLHNSPCNYQPFQPEQLDPTPHYTLVIMWGRDKNLEVLIMFRQAFEQGTHFCLRNTKDFQK